MKIPVVSISSIQSFITDFLFKKDFREDSLSFFLNKKYYHQTMHDTELDRYPELFNICREYFKNLTHVKILSFGCSTGEEVATIGKYIPQAFVVGADISNRCITACNEKYKADNNRFINSKSEEFKKSGNFDAIFCLAVFQRAQTQPKKKIEYISNYQFDAFEKQIVELDTKLNSNGLLFIDRSDFRFSDTKISKAYSPLLVNNNQILRDRPVFNSENRREDKINNSYRVFVKQQKGEHGATQ